MLLTALEQAFGKGDVGQPFVFADDHKSVASLLSNHDPSKEARPKPVAAIVDAAMRMLDESVNEKINTVINY